LKSQTMRSMIPIVSTVNLWTVILTVVLAGDFAHGAPAVVGTVTAQGAFRIDGSTIPGNATLFEGSWVEAGTSVVSVKLSRGVEVSLAAASRGRFFGDHVVLETGIAQLEKGASFRVEARSLSIAPATGDALARVTVGRGTQVRVAAVKGSFRVLNSNGLLIANLAATTVIDFESQSSNPGFRLTGCLVHKGGHVLVTDETTNLAVELVGLSLVKELGNRVEVTGVMDPTTIPASNISQVIRVTAVKRIAKGCATGSAAAAGAGGRVAAESGAEPGEPETGGSGTGGSGNGSSAPGGPAPVGRTTGGASSGGISAATVAIVGGVAAVATVGGLLAAGQLPGHASAISSISQ
jgi:hypothetical protein